MRSISTRPTLHELLSRNKPLLLPVAHDALSARLIERAGFSAAALGGFGIVGCRLGLPDLGLASFGELRDALRDISGATRLPLVVDADDGYGDVKNVVRTVREYEALNASAIVLEDQRSPKKCGHMVIERSIVPVEEAEAKLAAALGARTRADLAIIARTDARSVEGLESALDRGRRYVDRGADALFIEAPTSIEELERIGRTFQVPLMVNAAEGGRTPLLRPQQYRDLGFAMVVYPSTLLLRMIKALMESLAALANGEFADQGKLPGMPELLDIMGAPEWMGIEGKHAVSGRE